jgi:hypothetical protein
VTRICVEVSRGVPLRVVHRPMMALLPSPGAILQRGSPR